MTSNHTVQIAFCGHCSVILPESAPDRCPNCGGAVYDPRFRVTGLFTRPGAQMLRQPLIEKEDTSHDQH